MKNKIDKVVAEEIKDSRGNPTLKVTVFSGNVSNGFSVPSGASTGANEALELRDEDGVGVKKAIQNVNEIINSALIGYDVQDQKGIDEILINTDGTKNKSNLGGNATIGVSIACAKTAAKANGKEIFEYLRSIAEIKNSRKVPYLYMNLINGGMHAKNGLAFQEYHIVPVVEDPAESIKIGAIIQKSLSSIIKEKFGENSLILGDEGGFAPKITDIKIPLLLLSEAINLNGFQKKVRMALDVAASSFYKNNLYEIEGKEISKDDLLKIYKSFVSEFKLLSIEDPFNEDDFASFKKVKDENSGLLVLGDDLTVTNISRVKEAVTYESINAMIIKPNQIGTLSETLETMKIARENNIELIVSHRSGETEDNFIADLAYAFGCFGLKSGAPQKPERKVKYDRLIEIYGK